MQRGLEVGFQFGARGIAVAGLLTKAAINHIGKSLRDLAIQDADIGGFVAKNCGQSGDGGVAFKRAAACKHLIQDSAKAEESVRDRPAFPSACSGAM